MIGVDWGTSSFRAYRMAGDGTILDRRSNPHGIMHVPAGDFARTLREAVGGWLKAGEDRVLLSGMIGSRQGWKEAPYLRCPAGVAELSAALVDIPFDGARVKLVPGIDGVDESGIAEVMRGEETQIVGALATLGSESVVACLPGTHSKWARVEAGRIVRFSTHMTGEVYGVLREHTILGRMMQDGSPFSEKTFMAGVQRSGDPGGLLHHIFGVRTQTLFGTLTEADGAAYLSGILIGHELRAALPDAAGKTVLVIGAPDLTALYARAISACGAKALCHDGEASAQGLAVIGRHATWN